MEKGMPRADCLFDEVDVQRFRDAGAYSLDDFRRMEKGTIAILHFKCLNMGELEWHHDHVEGDRVFGQFESSDDELTPVGGYLYECCGFVCKGSGAEPVCRRMPEHRGDDGEGY